MFDHGLKKEQKITGYKLREIFKVSNMGGMRKSKPNNVLVLITHQYESNHCVYHDKWEGDILFYTGEGREGDQKLTRQNKILYNSNSTNIEIYLFEVKKASEYIYKGRVELCGEVKTEKQSDKNNIMRNVFIFPLKIVE